MFAHFQNASMVLSVDEMLEFEEELLLLGESFQFQVAALVEVLLLVVHHQLPKESEHLNVDEKWIKNCKTVQGKDLALRRCYPNFLPRPSRNLFQR